MRRMSLGWMALLALIITALPAAAQSGTPIPAASPVADAVTVDSASGPIRGQRFPDYDLFQGIPYAEAPVGELRWQPPRPAAPWTETLDATASGSICPQPENPLYGDAAGDKDCLYLNVAAPRGADPDTPKPVMVWLHGGAFLTGAGSIYDGHALAVSGDVIVVTLNYRLGVFGFFAYPELDGGGTFGFQDQQLALRWVQDNIAAFGGDPAQVTLFGESAGALSVCAHLAAPDSAGLFHRAIIQSGPCTLDFWVDLEEFEQLGSAFAGSVGCGHPATALACLRELAPEALSSELALAFSIIAHGNDILPVDPGTALRAGDVPHVPTIIGTTRDEHVTFVALEFGAEPISPEDYQALLADAFGDDADRVAGQYADLADESPRLAWIAIMTDSFWACSNLESSRLLAEHAPTFTYEFADRTVPNFFGLPIDEGAEAFHGSELLYLFFADPSLLNAEQYALATTMLAYWTNFAHSGDPNSSALPEWPAVAADAAVPAVLSLAPGPNGIGLVDLGAEHNCDFWAGLEE